MASDDRTTPRPWDGFEVTYAYDAADRLREALRMGSPPEGTQRFVYNYDTNGNRTNLNWPGPPGPNTQGVDYTYDREDRLILAQAYQTNQQGHCIDREVTRLFYDGLGRQLAKEYDPRTGAGGVKRTEYVLDGLDPVVEYFRWNGRRAEFYRGGVEAFSPVPMLLQMRHFPEGTQGQAYWYHLDGRGSVAGLTKHRGQSTHNYRYEAYGQLLPAQGNWTAPHNPYTFLGKEWDEALRLYEFGVRLYDPWAGVWLTRETLPGQAGEPRTWHRYAYAFANPINYVDLYGHQAGGIGLCGLFALPGLGTTGCAYIVVDQYGQVGWILVRGGGGYIPYGAGIGISLLASNVSDIQELSGWSVVVGGSVSFIAKKIPLHLGPDFGIWRAPEGQQRWAADINIGVGFKVHKGLPEMPAEIHGYALFTTVGQWFNVFDILHPHSSCWQEEDRQEPPQDYWPSWPYYGSPP